MSIFVFIVVVLVALAVADLIVGVSNDAVNFLNSAIGSKVATYRTIMIIAAVGVLVGATFSSGLMEVARKGIFNPDLFRFRDVMIIFLAVMLTDIVLLDLFNSLSLPTSTTVSIVFELLGASIAIAAFKVLTESGLSSQLLDYVNVESALFIIGGIFLSVFVAFSVGAIVQFLSRLLFTFAYRDRLGNVGIAWAAACLTGLCFFLVIKGLKGASFVSAGVADAVQEQTLLIGAILFVVWAIVVAIMHWRGYNYLKFVVLFGTFSLAMAFAGNDLVNFIGVPVAGFDAFRAWMAAGQPDMLLMTELSRPIQTSTYVLLAAGAVMAVTLWRSRKAATVVRTGVELARQHDGYERFKANGIAHGTVRLFGSLGKLSYAFMPRTAQAGLSRRMDQAVQGAELDHPDASFDLVRASVNLAVASALIAWATSMKLPLSTTYVSFMVAMGASLADGAWSSESAAARVSGVLTVIAGWLLTAVTAMTAAGLVALFIRSLGLWSVFPALGIVITILWYNKRQHDRIEEKRRSEGGPADV